MTAGVIPLEIIPPAQAAQKRWGCPASVCLAQWALESAWGAAMSGKNNPFGIKAKAGEPFTPKLTWEVIDGKHVRVTQNFRDFASMDEAFDQHGKLLATGSAYAGARAVKSDPEAYAHALTGHYATDPAYGSKLISIMSAHKLMAYDAGGMPAPTTAVASAAPIVLSPGPVAPHITGLPAAPRLGFWASLLAGIRGKAA